MKRESQDVVGGKFVKDSIGGIKVKEKDIMNRWREYFNELLNEQNEYQVEEDGKVEGPLKEITEVEVETAIKAMRKGRAAGPTGMTSDLLQAAGKTGASVMTGIVNDLMKGDKVPGDWSSSTTIPIYKGKGDAMDCGKYRGVRLLEHGMKIYERVLERRLRDLADVGDYQYGFCPGKSTIGAVFIVRQLQENFARKKQLYHIFVDLEKAFDRVPREVLHGL